MSPTAVEIDFQNGAATKRKRSFDVAQDDILKVLVAAAEWGKFHRATGRCGATLFMIRHVVFDCTSAVQLLAQHHPKQLVRQRDFA